MKNSVHLCSSCASANYCHDKSGMTQAGGGNVCCCPKYVAGFRDLDMSRGVYQCFHCGDQAVLWMADFSYEDYGYEGDGIIHECQCSNCGAHITYFVPLDEEECL